jgi:hypothetical protein
MRVGGCDQRGAKTGMVYDYLQQRWSAAGLISHHLALKRLEDGVGLVVHVGVQALCWLGLGWYS